MLPRPVRPACQESTAQELLFISSSLTGQTDPLLGPGVTWSPWSSWPTCCSPPTAPARAETPVLCWCTAVLGSGAPGPSSAWTRSCPTSTTTPAVTSTSFTLSIFSESKGKKNIDKLYPLTILTFLECTWFRPRNNINISTNASFNILSLRSRRKCLSKCLWYSFCDKYFPSMQQNSILQSRVFTESSETINVSCCHYIVFNQS